MKETQQAFWLVTWWHQFTTSSKKKIMLSKSLSSYEGAERFASALNHRYNTDFEITGPFYKRLLK